MQRQRLPLSACGRSARCSASSAAAVMIMPAVQKPHWNACASRKACCIGCSAPFSRQALDRRHFAPGGAEGGHQAAMHRRAVEPDGAGAAIAGIAALLHAKTACSRRKVRRHWPGSRLGFEAAVIDAEVERAGGVVVARIVHARAPAAPARRGSVQRSGRSGGACRRRCRARRRNSRPPESASMACRSASADGVCVEAEAAPAGGSRR